MKKFLAIYKGSGSSEADSAAESMSAEAQRAGIAAWGKWVEENQKSIIDMGTPLGKTKRVGKDGVSDTKNNDVAYVILQAQSHEAAAKLFIGHPHFTVFPGDAVEIMECLPLPDSRE